MAGMAWLSKANPFSQVCINYYSYRICLSTFPRDPGSPKLRMVSWNLNTFRFGGDYTRQSSSEEVIGSLYNPPLSSQKETRYSSEPRKQKK